MVAETSKQIESLARSREGIKTENWLAAGEASKQTKTKQRIEPKKTYNILNIKTKFRHEVAKNINT